MTKKRLSGLDELMIVNPGLPDQEKAIGLGQVFIGEDGSLYRLEGLQEEAHQPLAEFYLGDDGTLYRLERVGPFQKSHVGSVEEVEKPGINYFLGEDGTVYQLIK